MRRSLLLSTSLALSLLTPTAALATPAPSIHCYDPVERPNVVYVTGSSALQPFLAVLAPILAADSPPFTLVFQAQGSCSGVEAIFSTDPEAQKIRNIPATDTTAANYAVTFLPDGTPEQCLLSPAGSPIDVAVSDVFAETCGHGPADGAQVADYLGPIQSMTFVVPAASSQAVISAEAAYMVFGMGGNGGAAAPWTDPAQYYVRNDRSGTQQLFSRAIGVPADQWWGGDSGKTDAIRMAMRVLLNPSTAEKAIGILSSDVADEERSNLRILAVQERGERCGFLPDSTPTSLDKRNVRDGHYGIWGPVHLFARVTDGLPNPAATALVAQFTSPKINKAVLDAIIAKHLVPQCAMRVRRSEEMGALASFAPSFQCGCYFEQATAGRTSCRPCAGPGDCTEAEPACNYGFCEAM